ncbi:MAG TPA: CHAT domain-containing tetratricopeptide repeat protein [Pyrinomonadaceae bacterium]
MDSDCGNVVQASPTGAESLLPGKPLTRKLAGGETHLYQVQMNSDQYLKVVVEQLGIDLNVSSFAPNGDPIVLSDLAQTDRGSEVISVIAGFPGFYRFEVRSRRKTDPPASYEIRIEKLEGASAANRAANSAATLIAEANRLSDRRTKESTTEAIAKYQQALALFDESSDVRMKAIVLNKIGRAHFSSGEYPKAPDYHHRALALVRATGDQHEEGVALTYLGDAYRLTSENGKALEYLNQAIQIWQFIQDRRGEFEALNIIARLHYGTGEVHKALFYFDRALDLARALSDQSGEMATLSGTAGAYYVSGDNEKAAEMWKEALALATAGKQQGWEMILFGKLGAVYNALGDHQRALDYLDQSLRLARDRGDRADEASTLQTIARVYRSMGEPKKSIELLDQSLGLLKDVNNPAPGAARAHYNLGKAYTDLGEYQKAIDYLNQALLVWKSRGDPINIAATIRELARAERGRGNLETALAQTEAAINVIEWVRAQAGGPDLRASYLAIVQDCFELRIDVLTRLHKLDPARGYADVALQTSEKARARSLIETLTDAGVDIRRGVPAALLKREQELAEQLQLKASELTRSTKTSDEGGKELKGLIAEYELVQAQVRAASPRYAELVQPRPLSLAEMRTQVIDGQTLLLEYYLGVERSYLWAVSSTEIQIYELPKRATIEAEARKVYDLLTARSRRVKFETNEERRARIATADANYPAAAAALSRAVLGPVADQLGNRRLLIVSDGALQYIPFAALPGPKATGSSFQPLALNNEIVSLPSASTLAVLRKQLAKRQPAPKTVAVLADPVFNADDQRVKDSLARNQGTRTDAMVARRSLVGTHELQRSASESGWNGESLSASRLPFTRKEADAIAALVPAAYRKQDLDFAASRASATDPELSQYRIVHFATHGLLNSRHPELSGIVLSLVDEKGRARDGFLRAHEIYDLKLPAELIVLSGCRTGLGREVRGEGLLGLTRAFMHAGAARVMVSLWDVNDEATAELMKHFYSSLLSGEKVSPAAALRAAQVSMARDKRWSAPYFWAAFTIQGEPQ